VLLCTWQVHPLARAQRTAAHDFGAHVVAHRFEYAQHDRAVGEVDVVAAACPLRERGQGGGDVLGVAMAVVVAAEYELLTAFEFHRVAHDQTAADLGARQIDQHADAAAENLRQFTRLARVVAVRVHIGVRRVEAYDIDAGFQQLSHRPGCGSGRADCGHDLRSAHHVLLDRFDIPSCRGACARKSAAEHGISRVKPPSIGSRDTHRQSKYGPRMRFMAGIGLAWQHPRACATAVHGTSSGAILSAWEMAFGRRCVRSGRFGTSFAG
jgi:hypothetical protein